MTPSNEVNGIGRPATGIDSASEAVGAVVSWLRANPVEPTGLEVPGATANQLGLLAALGPVAKALLASESPVQMPPGLVSWMEGRPLPAELLGLQISAR